MQVVAQIIKAVRQLTDAERWELDKALNPRRYGERKPERNALIYSDHQRGLTPGQIARKIGMTRGAVKAVLRRHSGEQKMKRAFNKRQLREARICFVCRQHAPEGEGVWWNEYGIIAHQGLCSDRVHSLERVCDRSPQGRRRRASEIAATLEEDYQRRGERSADEAAPNPLVVSEQASHAPRINLGKL
jgi:hypothetical protein